MAYLDMELRNARLIWARVGDNVLTIGLILLAMGLASIIAMFLGYGPYTV